jgi:3-oxoacyl-[acyl-carrier protein] reductase
MTALALVTGASRGIGRAAALAFAARGVDLALWGRPSAGLRETVARCAGAGVRAEAYACDLGDGGSIERAARDTLVAQGAPTAVIHNAAVLERGPRIHEIDPQSWERVLAVNLTGPFLTTRALLPAMLRAGRGRFVFVASISATIGSPQMAHYGASKWGLVGLAKSLADELRGSELASIAILPGSVATEMLQQTPFEATMTPADVAAMIVFYALDAPAAVSGAAVEMFGP